MNALDRKMMAAVQLHQAGKFAEAERAYRQVLEQQPRHAGALHLLGVLAHQHGQHERAIELISQAIAVDARPPEFHLNLANAFQATRRHVEAAQGYAAALSRDPKLPEAHFNLSNAMRALNRLEESEASARRAVQLRPNYPQAWNALASALAGQNRFNEALAAYQQALKWNPRSADSFYGLANVYRRAGDLPASRECLLRAIAIDPNNADTHASLGTLMLKVGEFDAGWREYEWRLRQPGTWQQQRILDVPMWEGQSIAGRTVLVRGEQGFGDVMQFARFLPYLQQGGARVLVECAQGLTRLMALARGVDGVVGPGQPTPKIDYWCPLLSLPFRLGLGGNIAAPSMPYLKADPSAMQRAGMLPMGTGRLRVGLVWAGNPSHLNDRNRSCPFSAFVPLLDVKEVAFVSLQQGTVVKQLAETRYNDRIFEGGTACHDWADTAGLVSHLDLVITVDTAAAHLAGGMGKPAWVLLPTGADWRWMQDERRDSPWYPTMRLWRQTVPGDWSTPVRAAALELMRMVCGGL